MSNNKQIISNMMTNTTKEVLSTEVFNYPLEYTKEGYYNMDTLLAKDAKINFILSVRNTGKSYQVMVKRILVSIMSGRFYVIARRSQPEITGYKIELKEEMEALLNGISFKEWKTFEKKNTNPDYNYKLVIENTEKQYIIINLYSKELIEGKRPEFESNYKWVNNGIALFITYYKACMSVKSISMEGWNGCDGIIFEECISETGIRMSNEVEMCFSLISTFERSKDDFRVYFLANTIDYSTMLMSHFLKMLNFTDIVPSHGRYYLLKVKFYNAGLGLEEVVDIDYCFDFPIRQGNQLVKSLHTAQMAMSVLNDETFNYMINNFAFNYNSQSIISPLIFYEEDKEAHRRYMFSMVNKDGIKFSVWENTKTKNIICDDVDSTKEIKFYALDKESEVLYNGIKLVDNRISQMFKWKLSAGTLFFVDALKREALAKFLKNEFKTGSVVVKAVN